jgi:LysR family transcriptional regulator, nitrogen assimilation regulatory protein
MELGALELFLAVAEQESFTRAAIRLGVTQPALSRRVHRLEEEFGVALFYRHGRGVILTEAGARLRAVAESILQQLRDVKAEVAATGPEDRGRVVLGLPPSLGATLSAPLMRRFRDEHPLAHLTIVEGFSGALLEWLESGRIDAAVLYDARRSPALLVNPLLREHLYLVARPTPDPGADPAGIEELGVGPFVLSAPANGMRRVVDAAAAKAGLNIDVTMEVDSVSAIRRIAEAGPERAVLPFGAVHRDVEDGRLSARRIYPGVEALLVTATPLSQPVTRLCRAVLRLIEDQVRRCLAEGVLRGVMAKATRKALPSDHPGLDKAAGASQTVGRKRTEV